MTAESIHPIKIVLLFQQFNKLAKNSQTVSLTVRKLIDEYKFSYYTCVKALTGI